MAYYDRTYRLGFGGGLTTAIKYLLLANGAVFLLQMVLPTSGGEQLLIKWFGMRPALVLSKFYVWQLFTYIFLHGDPWHLIINMFFLWMFGCEVERTLGTREFLKYYFICGVGAGIFHLVINFNSPTVVVGASGAIYGVMVAFAVLFPERVITLLLFLILPVQIKAKYLVMIFAGISLLLGAFGSNDGVAHFAHLGGMLVGFAYLKLGWRLDHLTTWMRQQRESRQAVQDLKKHQAMQRIRERVDEILDKINEVGYDQLDENEKRILQEASEKFSQEKEPES
ncbi:MAG: rhomboid family intramembrane serine protease [Caldithrix sp.]|nr:MAG: rhomboid family intramembrane serine protease [Caldithrix sp.]